MAIYHCTCKVISRGKGRSAVGAAAYRSGTEIVNEYDGLVHDYTNKSGVAYSEVMLCANAPAEYADRAVLWNAVERVEKSAKAQLCREYEMALPRELTPEERVAFVRDFIKKNFTDKGMIADFSIHDKGDGNPHVHILLTMRPIEKDGSWGDKQQKEYILDKHGNKQYDKKKKTYKCKTVKTTDWDTKENLQRNRESWASAVNTVLKDKGIADRVDHRSLEAQGIDRLPTVHEGAARAKREKDKRKYAAGLIAALPELPHSLAVNEHARLVNSELEQNEKELSALELALGQLKADLLWIDLYDAIEEANWEVQISNTWDINAQKVHFGKIEMLQNTVQTIIDDPLMEYHSMTVFENGIAYLDHHKTKAADEITKVFEVIQSNIRMYDYLKEEEDREAREKQQYRDDHFLDLIDAARDYIHEAMLVNDTRKPVSPTFKKLPDEIPTAIEEYLQAINRRNEVSAELRQCMFWKKKKREELSTREYELDLEAKKLLANVRKLGVDLPEHFSKDELMQAAQQRIEDVKVAIKSARPANIPEGSAERQNAALSRFEEQCSKLPMERREAARVAVMASFDELRENEYAQKAVEDLFKQSDRLLTNPKEQAKPAPQRPAPERSQPSRKKNRGDHDDR